MNVIHATFKALESMQSPYAIAEKRGLPLSRILGEAHVEENASETA